MLPEKMMSKIADLEQTALIELWDIDFRSLGGRVHYLCNQVNELGKGVVWQGRTYEPYPIQGDGFELSNENASARPKISLSNASGLITAAAHSYGQLLGVPITRRRTLASFLDAANFANGNKEADPSQEILDLYVVERIVSMDRDMASLELSTPAESDGSVLPSRIMLTNICCWTYRGEGCQYTGRPVADIHDRATNDTKLDACSHTVQGCKARFGATAVLPFGGWLSADKVS